MVELLSPVGDFDCLKAAVQNGADAVYFGASLFNARAFASNFDDETLEQAINYAKIRGVKTNLTLNTLIKNDEFADAINLAKKAYKFGIDAIIVQDLGLAKYLIDNFPGLSVHGSTQMSIHNLDGVLKLEKMGFSRVVLSRELSFEEIEYICKNSNIEIEVFAHGALCMSYSGQCLFSSLVGGRSGNRGKCAQPCRLPYELLENSEKIDKGYLLSPRDLCGLDYLTKLVKAGVKCFKIEGRMKTPEYVATVTRIYRKYLDLALLGKDYTVSEQDKKDLMQVFNRGGFSNGHLDSKSNNNFIFKQKSNNMGIFLGTIENFSNNNGYVTFKTVDFVNIGDKIAIENKKDETSLYTISELMINKQNIKQAKPGDKITIGRMKGEIYIGNKIYKMSDKFLTTNALATLEKEQKKIPLNCKLIVKRNLPISLKIHDENNLEVENISNIIPVDATNSPITIERLESQLSKTNNTPFVFKNIDIDLDDGLYVQSISGLNELRRNTLLEYENKLIYNFKRDVPKTEKYEFKNISATNKSISLLLNILNVDFNYLDLNNVSKVYIPLKYFAIKEYEKTIKTISNKFNTYIYMPTVMRNNYNKIISNKLSTILDTFKINGFVISNIGNLKLLHCYKDKYEFISNYTFNVFNDYSINKLDVDIVTLSPELNKLDLKNINSLGNCELIVYGRAPLMNTNYCLLGSSNKCYSNCNKKCLSNNKYYLKDRLGFLFRVIPDNIDTVTTIYNSKITSIEHGEIPVSSIRIDILDESIEEINNIIEIVKLGKKLEGQDYTNGNFARNI